MTIKDPSVCCAEFDPSLFNEKSHRWEKKLFLKDYVLQIMHIPLTMGSVVKRMVEKVERAKAMPEVEDFLLLAYDPSPWRSELYMTVTKPVTDGEMTSMSGEFISKVYDGPYNDVPKWMEDLSSYIAKQGKSSERYYFHYAYCPQCSKKYGHNYCVAFAKVG